jgi:hypothetical protein
MNGHRKVDVPCFPYFPWPLLTVLRGHDNFCGFVIQAPPWRHSPFNPLLSHRDLIMNEYTPRQRPPRAISGIRPNF